MVSWQSTMDTCKDRCLGTEDQLLQRNKIKRQLSQRLTTYILCSSKAVFRRLSKAIVRLVLLRLVIGLKLSRQFFNQWEAIPKPIAPCMHDVSRTLIKLQMIAGKPDWFTALFDVVIGWGITLVLVFRKSIENRSNGNQHFLSIKSID